MNGHLSQAQQPKTQTSSRCQSHWSRKNKPRSVIQDEIMDKYHKTAESIFTEDFLIFLDTVPRTKKDKSECIKLYDSLGVVMDKKKISNCILSLTYYLSAILVNNDIDFEQTMKDIEKYKSEFKIENYIQ